jgi:acyl-CoA reductase-like NAD-dependent aldehyde dehydrogenase
MNLEREEFVKIMPYEMGTTISFSREVHMPVGIGHIEAAVEALKSHTFERPSARGGSTLVDEPVGIVWHDYTMELACEPSNDQSCTGIGCGMYDGA